MAVRTSYWVFQIPSIQNKSPEDRDRLTAAWIYGLTYQGKNQPQLFLVNEYVQLHQFQQSPSAEYCRNIFCKNKVISAVLKHP